jgi:hypothetical protein
MHQKLQIQRQDAKFAKVWRKNCSQDILDVSGFLITGETIIFQLQSVSAKLTNTI